MQQIIIITLSKRGTYNASYFGFDSVDPIKYNPYKNGATHWTGFGANNGGFPVIAEEVKEKYPDAEVYGLINDDMVRL